MRLRVLIVLVLTAAAVVTVSAQQFRGLRFRTGSAATGVWALAYTPYTYPHPLQSAWVSSCGSTTPAASNSQADVQSAVNAAADDDCITIPAGGGTATWASAVAVTNKRIQIIGPGEASLTLTCQPTCFSFRVSTTPTKPWRLSALTLSSTGDNPITCRADEVTVPVESVRFDHLTLLVGNGQHGINCNGGMVWGLIDHLTCGDSTTGFLCTFFGSWTQNDYNTTGRCNPAYTTPTSNNTACNGYDSWNYLGLDFGTSKAMYIEDSSLLMANTSLPFVNDLVDGSRMVYRFNTCTACTYQAHFARATDRGGNIKSEIYRNTFTGNGFLRVWGPFGGGSALTFENTVSGYTDNNFTISGQREDTPDAPTGCRVSGISLFAAPQNWDASIEASGWPLLDGTGRGGVTGQATNASQQTWAPYRAWSNGTSATCATGGSCNNTSNHDLNAACNGTGPNGNTFSSYVKPYNSPHTNGQWDYMDHTTGGVYVVATVGNLPGTCFTGEWAWVTGAGSWNASGQDGLGYLCQ